MSQKFVKEKINHKLCLSIHKCNKMKEAKYPENLPLKLEIVKARRTITEIASAIGVSREVLTNTVNGHYKGSEVVRKLKSELNLVDG